MNRSVTSVVLFHLIGWLLFFGLIIGFVSTSATGSINSIPRLLTASYFLFFFIYLFLFYFNSFILVPLLFLRKNYVSYFFIITIFLVMVYYLQPFDRLINNNGHANTANGPVTEVIDQPPAPGNHPPPPAGHPPPEFDHPAPGRDRQHPPPGEFRLPPGAMMNGPGPQHGMKRVDIVSIVLLIMVLSISTALQLIKQWSSSEQRAAKAEAGKANAELSFLKAQINPHFLFNTLNNIYAMAITKNEATPDSIMKLSNMMRYVTDEVSEDYTSLESEVNCVSNYIDLQRLRISKRVQISFRVSGSLEGKQVAPLILMPFVENVFKYGISNHEPSDIDINLVVEEKAISFLSRNKIFEMPLKADRPGVGIKNTQQRLEHLYPGKYSLTISSLKGFYTVQLKLNI